MLKTQLSVDELLALHPCDIVEKGRDTVHYLKGTKSLVSAYPSSVQYDWQYFFGVEHNTIVSVDIDPETSPETMQVLDELVGPFIKAVGGEGWMDHIDIPRVHWTEDVVRIDHEASERIVLSVQNAGLKHELADLRAELEED